MHITISIQSIQNSSKTESFLLVYFNMEIKDEVFKDPITQLADFKFDKKVVTVFDDMVTRSVPCYLEIQRMIAELAAEYAKSGTIVYDLGCSTGSTLKNMDNAVASDIKFHLALMTPMKCCENVPTI